jgi:hypothetical protein
MDEIAIGRKEIMRLMHCGTWNTIQKWKTKYPGFNKILRQAPNTKPFIVISEGMSWLTEYDKLSKSKK